MEDDSIDMVILEIDMGYLVTLLVVQPGQVDPTSGNCLTSTPLGGTRNASDRMTPTAPQGRPTVVYPLVAPQGPRHSFPSRLNLTVRSWYTGVPPVYPYSLDAVTGQGEGRGECEQVHYEQTVRERVATAGRRMW